MKSKIDGFWRTTDTRPGAGDRPPVAMLLVLFLVGAAFLASVCLATEEVVIEGVLHVKNGPEPRDGLETWRLEEQWRAGGEDDDIIFGLITKVCTDPAGNVYLLDAQLNQVHVYSPSGQFLRTLFREGEGPGEIQGARDIIVLPDGRVGAIQEFPGKIVFVDAAGDPAGTLECGSENPNQGGFWSLNSSFSGGGQIVLSGTFQTPSDDPGISNRTNFLSRFDQEGKEEVRFCESKNQYNFRDFVFDESVHVPGFWWNTAVGPDGRVFTCPEKNRYAIEVYRPDGTLDRVIEREYTRYKRTEQEKQRVHGMIESAMAGVPFQVSVKVEEYESDLVYILRGLRARWDGSLWTVTSRGVREQPSGILATFDVFDPQGVFTKQVAIACEGNGIIDGVFFAGTDRVLVVHGFADAVAAQFGRGSRYGGEEDEATTMEVVCYRVVGG